MLDDHRQALRVLHWRETVNAWFAGEPMRHQCSTVLPTEETWKAMKP